MTHSHDTPTPAMSVESEYVLVPREPSEAMLRDGVMAWTMPWADVIPQDIDEDRYILAAVYRAMIAAAPAPNPSPAAKGGEVEALRERIARALNSVLGSQDDDHPRHHPAQNSGEEPSEVWWTQWLEAADVVLAALATPSPQPADAVREAVEEARSLLKVEYYDDGRIAAVGHDSDGLRKMVALLDAALSTPTEGPASQTEGMGGEVKAKAKQALYSLRFEGQPMSSMFSAEELGLIVDTVSAALTPPETAGAVSASWHADDIAVDRFAVAMKATLAKARAKGKGGWHDETACSRQYLSDELRRHALKPDPVDVANFAMFLHQRGETIAPATDDRERLVEALRKIEEEAKVANDVIRLSRDGQGQGRVRVVTAMHRIAEWTRATLATETSR